jgi:two-component system OmpR family response regulator
MLPGEDGLQICQRLRARLPKLPILIVTAKDDPIDRIIGLEVGADDYLAKPLTSANCLPGCDPSFAELVILRRLWKPKPVITSAEGWLLRLDARDLLDPAGRLVTLTTSEFDRLHTCCCIRAACSCGADRLDAAHRRCRSTG